MKKIALLILAAMTLVLTGCSKEKIVINGIEDLNGKKIGVQGGTTGEAWVQDNVDGAKISSFKSGIDAALDLKSGAIDVVVLDELPAIEIVNHNSDLMIVRSPVFADNREEYAIAVKKGNENSDKIQALINALKTDKVKKFIEEEELPKEKPVIKEPEKEIKPKVEMFPQRKKTEPEKKLNAFEKMLEQKKQDELEKQKKKDEVQIKKVDFNSRISGLQNVTILLIIYI